MALRLIKDGGIPLIGDDNLDFIEETGTYHQPLISKALPERNYPEKTAGLLEVHNPNRRMTYQRYTCFQSGSMYYRGSYDKEWKPWKKVLTE